MEKEVSAMVLSNTLAVMVKLIVKFVARRSGLSVGTKKRKTI